MVDKLRVGVVALADLSEQAMKDFDKHFSPFSDYRPEHFTDARAMLEIAGSTSFR